MVKNKKPLALKLKNPSPPAMRPKRRYDLTNRMSIAQAQKIITLSTWQL